MHCELLRDYSSGFSLLGASLNVAQLVRSLDVLPSGPRAAHMEIGSLEFGGPAENPHGCVQGLSKYGVLAHIQSQFRLDLTHRWLL